MNTVKNKLSAKSSHPNELKPRVYSYTRFSSPEQANGDSLRRQIEAADKFATDNKMVLDNSLKMIDRGLSGFHGTNRTEGALGAFLKNVEDGLVASGSILLVENIDRLGREPVLTAMETVNRLLKNGITIQTLSPRDTYTMQSVNDGGIWHLIVHIERAHGESKRKSDLAKTNWKQKRKLAEEDGHKLTTRCPAWFELNKNNLNEKGRYNLSKDKLFIPIPAAIKTIQLIFKLKLQGFGKNIIARKLNEGAEWPRKNGWHASYVEKILNNRAVIGEYQPFSKASGKRIALGEPIKNYFPAIVDEGTFHATQKLKSKNKNTGGETGKATNVFRHLVRCGYCGGPMTFIDKGNPPKGGKYLICDNGRRGADVEIDGEIRKCVATGLSYKEFEETVLSNLPKLRPEMVLLKDDEKETKVKALDNVIAGLEGRLTDIERGQNNVVIGMEKTDSEPLRARLKRRFDELENERAVIEPQIEQRKAERDLAKRGKADFEKWKQDLTGLKEAIAEDINARIRLKAHLKEFVERIEIFPRGNEDNVTHLMDILKDSTPDVVRAESYKDFRRYITKKMLSSEGRCYQLHLRINRPLGVVTDKKRRQYPPYQPQPIPLAPPQSLAESWTAGREKSGGSRFNTPKIKELFDAFFDGRKSGFVPKASLM